MIRSLWLAITSIAVAASLGALAFLFLKSHKPSQLPLESAGLSNPTRGTTITPVTHPGSTRAPAIEKEQGVSTPMWREKMIERLEPILQERLRNEGFSQDEIDLMARQLIGEIRKPGDTIKISDAVDHTAEALNLDPDKKNKLNMAVLNSYAQSIEITYEQWNQCLNYRVQSMPKCVQDIAHELSRNVASVTSTQLFTSEERLKREEFGRKAQTDAVQQCGLSAEAADSALTFVLSGCPD